MLRKRKLKYVMHALWCLQFYEDSCLLEQKYVMDELRRVGQVTSMQA